MSAIICKLCRAAQPIEITQIHSSVIVLVKCW